MSEDYLAIDHVFSELKTRTLIAPKRRLRRKNGEWPLDFGSTRVLHRICYNERYATQRVDLLRFALLHEEEHITSCRTQMIWWGKDIICLLLWALLMYLSLALLFRLVTPVLFCLLVTPLLLLTFLLADNASQRLFRKALGMEESRADLGASSLLISKLGNRKPSVTAAALIKLLRDRPRDRTSVRYRMRKHLTVEFHPSDEARIKAIQELEESLAENVSKDGDVTV